MQQDETEYKPAAGFSMPTHSPVILMNNFFPWDYVPCFKAESVYLTALFCNSKKTLCTSDWRRGTIYKWLP